MTCAVLCALSSTDPTEALPGVGKTIDMKKYDPVLDSSRHALDHVLIRVQAVVMNHASSGSPDTIAAGDFGIIREYIPVSGLEEI